MNDQDLENLFAEHGTVTSAKIITDRMTNRSRGFGFVEMSDGAEAAIEALNETEIEDSNWNVDNILSYDKAIGKHNFNALLGYVA
jgi:RNA recognition motif-containing protein